MAKVSLARLLADASKDAGPSYISYLRQVTSEPNQHVRWAAVFALGEVGSDSDLALLEKIVLNDNSSVSEKAVKAIARLDTPSARITLQKLSNDPMVAPGIKSVVNEALKYVQ